MRLIVAAVLMAAMSATVVAEVVPVKRFVAPDQSKVTIPAQIQVKRVTPKAVEQAVDKPKTGAWANLGPWIVND